MLWDADLADRRWENHRGALSMALRVARGLFRLWLVLSVLWIGGVGVWTWLTAKNQAYWGGLSSIEKVWVAVVLALVPPAFVLALGSALVWAFRGFRQIAKAEAEAKPEASPILWKRGFFRAWVVAAVLWIAAAAWIQIEPPTDYFADIGPPRIWRVEDYFADIFGPPRTRSGCEEAAKTEPLVNVEACVERAHMENWRDARRVMWALLPPVLMLMFGGVIAWTIQGFRPPDLRSPHS
jgi:hypothetical protein